MTGYEVRIAHLYPNLMNIYGDRGNTICLRRRCRERGVAVSVTEIGIGDEYDPEAYDLVVIGGGQDREQRRIASDLAAKGAALREAVAADVPMLAVCGGFQLMGRDYRTGDGETLQGTRVFDAVTVHPGDDGGRCIGNVIARSDVAGGSLVGFENHGGRTYLGAGAQPLAWVLEGFGNNGEDGTEGAVSRRAYGTYLHGSLLPKNPAFADKLIAEALERRYGEKAPALVPLDDTEERAARSSAMRLRGGARGRRW